jgi:chromosome segregation ATPase
MPDLLNVKAKETLNRIKEEARYRLGIEEVVGGIRRTVQSYFQNQRYIYSKDKIQTDFDIQNIFQKEIDRAKQLNLVGPFYVLDDSERAEVIKISKYILFIKLQKQLVQIEKDFNTFVPFMQLTPTDRRQVIENILDISIFSQMNVVVKDKVNGVKSELDATNTQIEVSKAQIADTKETIQSLVKNTQQIIEERKAAQAQLEAQMVAVNGDIEELSEPLKISGTSIQTELKEVQKKRTDAQKILGKIEQAKESINEDIEFFNNNETCSLCKQGIAHDHKDTLLTQRKTKLEEYQQGTQDINTQITKTEKQIAEIQSRLDEHQTNVIRLANKRETLMN